MPGKITFHFDDCFITQYEQAFPVFQKAGAVGCLVVAAGEGRHAMTFDQMMEMQNAGWEIICHTFNHVRMAVEPLSADVADYEVVQSKHFLEHKGFRVRQFVTPYSGCHADTLPLLRAHYDAAFTVYKNSNAQPIEELVIQRPVQRYRLNRAVMSGHTLEELKAFVDYVAEHDDWLIFYEHELGVGKNITAEILEGVVRYCQEKGVEILTSSEALDRELCTTRILREGFDGKECFVHARTAAKDDFRMITAQKMDVTGCDFFECLQVNTSTDGGHTWTGFQPDVAFMPLHRIVEGKNLRTVCCDMTPMYHKKTGKYMVTGHTANYLEGSIRPIADRVDRKPVYAVYDMANGCFDRVRFVQMPDDPKYYSSGSGCSQCVELENGDILMPISYQAKEPGMPMHQKVAILRCTFDGITLSCVQISNELDVPEEVRGIVECSIVAFKGKYYLTIRSDAHGYVSVSDGEMHFTQPHVWCWDNGDILPTYNTQSHWMHIGGKLYLVYTRKNGTNDHVFRHRAPLYAAEVDTDALRVKADTEFVAVPERGARLGNFGVCSLNENTAFVTASEWMQPIGCEKYGSNNALWFTTVHMEESNA